MVFNFWEASLHFVNKQLFLLEKLLDSLVYVNLVLAVYSNTCSKRSKTEQNSTQSVFFVHKLQLSHRRSAPRMCSRRLNVFGACRRKACLDMPWHANGRWALIFQLKGLKVSLRTGFI